MLQFLVNYQIYRTGQFVNILIKYTDHFLLYTHFLEGVIAFSTNKNDTTKKASNFSLYIVSIGYGPLPPTGLIDYFSAFILPFIYYTPPTLATLATLRFFRAGDAISS